MWFAFHCFDRHHILPSQYAALPIKEKAMVRAFIEERIKLQKQQSKK